MHFSYGLSALAPLWQRPLGKRFLCLGLTAAIATSSLVQAQVELIPDDLSPGDRLGWSISSSGDGERVVASAHLHDSLGSGSGGAYVFRRDNQQWTTEALLLAPDGESEAGFGKSVAISKDGTRIVAGSPGFDVWGPRSGKAYIFVRNGEDWTFEDSFVPDEQSTFAEYGHSVSINADGSYVSVGAWASQEGNTSTGIIKTGSTYVYNRTPKGWELQERITPILANFVAYSSFGEKAVLDDAGATLAIKDRFADGNVRIYVRDANDKWRATQTIRNGLEFQSASFGLGLDLTAAGDFVAIGDQESRRVVIYKRNADLWTFIEAIEAPDIQAFGHSLALDDSGDNLLVGGFSTNFSGQVNLYTRVPDTEDWELNCAWTTPTPSDLVEAFGYSVELDARGESAFASAPFSQGVGEKSGKVLLWSSPNEATSYCEAKLNSAGCQPALSSQGTASAGSPSAFTISATDLLNNSNGLLFFGLGGAADLPFSGGTLCVQPPVRRTSITNSFGDGAPAMNCSGSYATDFNAEIQTLSILQVGSQVNVQHWSRDEGHPDGTGVGLTDALEFVICL